MAEARPAGAWVEVRGFPPEAAEELLVLYFENRRRSGGGPVRDFRRKGPRALLAFEQASDAERVLSKTDHVLQGIRLEVRLGPPRDPKKVLLHGLSPQSSQDLVELYVEHMLKCDRGAYSLFRSPDGRQALVQLQGPISHAEFLLLAEQVGGRPLEGSALGLEWLEQTEGLLVRSRGGKEPLQKDLLELYFESKRSGGGPVREVRLLPGGHSAIVTFQEPEAVERVLQQGSHKLPGVPLDVCPHYDFLEPPEEKEEEEEEEEEELWEVPNGGGEGEGGTEALPEEPPQLTWIPLPEEAPPQLLQSGLVLQELSSPVPECSLRLEGLRLCISGGDPATRSRLEAHVQEALRGAVVELVPLPDWTTADFLRREDVQQGLAERLAKRQVAACFLPPGESGASVTAVALTALQARLAASLLGSFLRRFSVPLSERHLPALASPAWERLQGELRLCLLRPAKDGTRLEGVALSGLEDENAERAEAFLRENAPDEALVAMEPGQLRFLQLFHQEVLAGLAHLAPLPIEGKDVTGLRLSGSSGACQAGAELLQSLLEAIHSQTVLLPPLPGISRFLLEDRGRAIIQGLEPRFRCAVGLERISWSPTEGRHELEMSQEPLALDCERDSPHRLQRLGVQGGTQRNQSGASLVEIKGLLAALQSPSAAPSLPAEEEDLYTTMEPILTDVVQKEEVTGEEEVQEGPLDPEMMEEGPLSFEELARIKQATEEEEEAQLLLAIQESMDSSRQEEEELRRATELSLLSWERERRPGSEEEAALLSAVNNSLANNEATLVVWAEAAGAAEGLREALEVALLAQVREEEVSHEALRRLPPLCRSYLAHLERKHSVRITLDGDKAALRGFADHPVAATRDLALLLARFLPAEAPVGGAQWVRWEASGQGSPTPYSAQASAILERAWQRGLRRVDLFFAGRPFTFDFHRMEEYDVGNAQTLPIGRMEAPADPDPMGPLAEDEVKLVPLAEGSEEFRDTVRRFYDTLEELHSKIRIIKVEKLVHPLLYRQYQLKKAAMEKACGHQEVERVLYHGTTEQSTREICQHGFNRSFCGRNATLYGHGVYFARKACLSVKEQYSPSGPSGNKHVFVARTLVGDFTAGSVGLRVPPFREGEEDKRDGGAPRRRYDSTVDCPHDPSIFVIFNDTQAYPQFLITCQWSKPR